MGRLGKAKKSPEEMGSRGYLWRHQLQSPRDVLTRVKTEDPFYPTPLPTNENDQKEKGGDKKKQETEKIPLKERGSCISSDVVQRSAFI